jgi:hypothetical protein
MSSSISVIRESFSLAKNAREWEKKIELVILASPRLSGINQGERRRSVAGQG